MTLTELLRDGIAASLNEAKSIEKYLFENDLVSAEMKCVEVTHKTRSLRQLIDKEKDLPKALFEGVASELRAFSDLEESLSALSQEIDLAKQQAERK